MDLEKVLADLLRERELLTEAITSLERLAVKPRRHSRRLAAEQPASPTEVPERARGAGITD